MARSLTTGTLREKKFKTYAFDGVWLETMGTPEVNNLIIVYGREKHGKTTFALMFAEYLSNFEKTLYVSAEEGLKKTFVDTIKRVGIDSKNKALHYMEYTPIDELDEKLSKRKSAKIIFIDNVTVFRDELKNGVLRKFLRKHNDKLFVFLAHQEDTTEEPYTATAKMIKKLADMIVRVEGLSCFISGRCPGGVLTIDENKAALYHGTLITE